MEKRTSPEKIIQATKAAASGYGGVSLGNPILDYQEDSEPEIQRLMNQQKGRLDDLLDTLAKLRDRLDPILSSPVTDSTGFADKPSVFFTSFGEALDLRNSKVHVAINIVNDIHSRLCL